LRLIYLTPNNFPATRADDYYVRDLARGFSLNLGKDFLFVPASDHSNELNGINFLSPQIKTSRLKNIFLFYIKYLLWLPNNVLFKNNTKDVIYFIGDPNLFLITYFYKKIFGFKFKICSDWHLYYKTWKYRFVAKKSNFIITTSNKLRNNIIEIFETDRSKIKTIYGGFNPQLYGTTWGQFELRNELGLPKTDILVGYVGFFSTMGLEKGMKTMIESLPYLNTSQVKIVLVGARGNELNEYNSIARKLGVSNKTIVVNAINNNLVSKYEEAMDILIIPYPDQEHFREYGFPMKIYEYLASKKPIIYSGLEIMSEILSDVGWPFESNNPRDLARTIDNVCTNTSEAIRKSGLGFDKVKNFTWRKKAENIIDVFKTITN
jgi:glycosyltransferase involved in cell wall biosynthesis